MRQLLIVAWLGFFLSLLAVPGSAQPSIAATDVGKDYIKVRFTSTFVPVAWRVCVKEGRLNPRPNCWAGAHDTIVYNSSATSQTGSDSITGLHKNRWYTVVVREQNPGKVWMQALGKIYVKTNK
jgi:hypothetical protein